MKIRHQERNYLLLAGPPGGWGAVTLFLVVGTVMGGGGTFFVWYSWTTNADDLIGALIAGGAVALFGYFGFLLGVGTLLTRDRLELDRHKHRGHWTRRLFGYNVKKPLDFELRFAKRIKLEPYTESTGRSGRSGSVRSEKVRARLLITKPRRAIVLDDAERQNLPRVRGVAQSVADFLEIELKDASAD